VNYSKAVASIAATVLAAVVAALTGDQNVDPSEWLNVLLLGTGAAAVLTAPNVPGAKYTKVLLAVVTAVAAAAASLILDGISTTDLLQLVLAALGAVGVYAAPYKPLASDGEVIGRFPRPTV
jgi:drug/metabolite transporter (DMT)-like permease